MEQLSYNHDYQCLMLGGYALHSGGVVDIWAFGSWLRGMLASDRSGWYLLTPHHVEIHVSPGLHARHFLTPTWNKRHPKYSWDGERKVWEDPTFLKPTVCRRNKKPLYSVEETKEEEQAPRDLCAEEASMNQRRDGQSNPLNDLCTHQVLKIIEGRWGRHVEEVISIKIEQFYQKRLIGNCWRYQPADMYLLEVTFSPDNELCREQFSLNQP